jgi:DNA-binding NarL/FixJ family response regulator
MPPDARTKAQKKAEFLVLDDEVRFASGLRRLLAPHGDVTLAHRVRDAIEAIPASGQWTAVFLDVELPDGEGFEVLEAFHSRGEHVPAVIITGHLEDAVANRAFDLGAKLLAKPITADHVRRFVAEVTGSTALREVVQDWRLRYSLTAAETEVLRAGLEGVERGAHAERRGISETTLRTHVRHMLQKSGDASLSDAIQRGLREVIARTTR